jgi:hypothetical protein
MLQWISKNLAPISFFTLVILAVVGVNISNQTTLTKAELLLNQASSIRNDLEKYDSFLLYRYSAKTNDYKIFASDVKNLTSKLEDSKKNLSPTPADDECNQLRSDLNSSLDYKIDQYKKVSFDLEPYNEILEDMKNIGQLKKAVLNTDKKPKNERLEILAKIDVSAKRIQEFYKNKRQGEPKLLEKVVKDTELMSKAYNNLKDHDDIENSVLEELKSNFGGETPETEQWPAENVAEYTLDYQTLGSNETLSSFKYLDESIKLVASKYNPDRLGATK